MNHTHDDRYYTETEINTKLASKSDTSHTHNYAASNHNHDTSYIKKTGDTMKGSLVINSPNDNNVIKLQYVGTGGPSVHHDISLIANVANEAGLYSYARGKWYLRVTAGGSVSFNGTAATALNISPTLLTANMNLNNVTTLGDYYCPSDVTSKTLANCPVQNAFAMRVFRWADSTGVVQEVTQYNPGINKRFVRTYYGTTGWGAWMEFINNGTFRNYFMSSFMIKSTSVEIAKTVEINEMGFHKTINTKSITGNKSCYIIPYMYTTTGMKLNCFSCHMNGGVDQITLDVYNHGYPSYKNITIIGTSVMIGLCFLAIPV